MSTLLDTRKSAPVQTRIASCTNPLMGGLQDNWAYVEAVRAGTSTETDAELLESYEERELLSLGSADALLGEEHPRYRCSDIYMSGWNWRWNDMRNRGEGPRCLLSRAPGAPAPLVWSESYQVAADEC